MLPLVLTLGLLACNQDISLGQNAQCDGVLNPQEDYVDSSFDRDGDGYFDAANPQCQSTYDAEDLDCDDGDEEVNPGAAEIPGNGIDDDCDGISSDASYSGTWNFTPTVQQACAMGMVNMSFTQLVVLYDDPNIAFNSQTSQPGTLSGTIDGTGAFSATVSIQGSCVETYTLTGSFTDATHFSASFSSGFQGTCLNCVGQQWSISATKME